MRQVEQRAMQFEGYIRRSTGKNRSQNLCRSGIFPVFVFFFFAIPKPTAYSLSHSPSKENFEQLSCATLGFSDRVCQKIEKLELRH